ncbi:MAG: hypothetical protein ACRBCK_00705 [Alphaproteobacteria bacterium]
MYLIVRRSAVSLLFALWLEFFYKFGATFDPHNFVGSILIYSMYLLLFHALIVHFLVKRVRTILIIAGFIGLMAEWFMIGNAPWINPNAFQPGMFVFHAVYPVLGLVFIKGGYRKYVQKRMSQIFIIAGIFCCLGFLIPHEFLRFAWFIWLPLIPYFISFFMLFFQKTLQK